MTKIPKIHWQVNNWRYLTDKWPEGNTEKWPVKKWLRMNRKMTAELWTKWLFVDVDSYRLLHPSSKYSPSSPDPQNGQCNFFLRSYIFSRYTEKSFWKLQFQYRFSPSIHFSLLKISTYTIIILIRLMQSTNPQPSIIIEKKMKIPSYETYNYE